MECTITQGLQVKLIEYALVPALLSVLLTLQMFSLLLFVMFMLFGVDQCF